MKGISIGSFSRLIFLFLGLVQVSDLFSAETSAQYAWRLLNEMSEAIKARDYKGTVVYLRDKKAETMRVFHALVNGVEKERVVSMNSPMREVVRSGRDVTCYLPDARLVYVSRYTAHRSFLVQLPEHIENDASFYRILLAGREYIIQKETQVVELRPKDEFRYGRKIWVDLETRLPLQFELIDENEEVVEQMIFTDLEVVDHLPPDSLIASANVETSGWEVRDGQAIADVPHVWTFDGIPRGFKQVFYRTSIMPTDREAVEHILFSDGFSSVSVYVDKSGVDHVVSHHKQWGAISSYSRLVDGYQITVLGAVPPKTVQSIGDGIHYLDGPQNGPQ